MTNMSPLEYLSRYVSVSSARRQLYNKVKNLQLLLAPVAAAA